MLRQIEHAQNSKLSSRSLDSIIQSVQALIPPPASLYYVCNRKRLERRVGQLAALDLELTALRNRAFAAGGRLTALHQQAHGEGVAP